MAEAKPNLQFNINPSICKHGDQQYLSMEPQITRITLIFNHEWTRMNTNWEQSTEYTEETEASQTSAIVLGSLLTICDFDQGGIGGPPSARRFVTLRASAKVVMRKFLTQEIFPRMDTIF